MQPCRPSRWRPLRGARAASPPTRPDLGVPAHPFELGQVRLTAGRWQNRTLADPRSSTSTDCPRDFRANHRLSTADDAGIVRWDDNGTDDHLWRFIPSRGAM